MLLDNKEILPAKLLKWIEKIGLDADRLINLIQKPSLNSLNYINNIDIIKRFYLVAAIHTVDTLEERSVDQDGLINGQTENLIKLRNLVLKTIQPAPEFQNLQQLYLQKLIKSLHKNLRFKLLNKLWYYLSDKQRIAGLKYVQNFHNKAFSNENIIFTDVPVEFVEIDPRTGTLGRYDLKDQKILLTDRSGYRPFSEVIGSLIHENSHAQQHQVALALQNHKIHQESPLYTQSLIFYMQMISGIYFNSNLFCTEDYIAYRLQPVEQHANLVGETTTSVLFAINPRIAERFTKGYLKVMSNIDGHPVKQRRQLVRSLTLP